MNIDTKTLTGICAGVVLLSTFATTVGNYLVFRPEFVRQNGLLQMQITEEGVKQDERLICLLKADGDLQVYIACEAEHSRYNGIRKYKELRQAGK